MMALIMGVMLLWFALPFLQTIYNTITLSPAVDTSDPNIQRLVDMGTVLFWFLGISVFVVTGYLAFAYATHNAPFDGARI